jgi:hypothetical protein
VRSRALESWFQSQRPTTLLVMRLLLVANACVLAVIGGLYLAFAARPGGLVVTGVVWGGALLLLALVPYTSPRRPNSRW